MLDGFASARAYQEGGFDLSAVLVNQPETGLVVQLPFAPTQAEEDDQDTESEVDDMPALEWDVSDDEDLEADIDEDIEDRALNDEPMSIEA